MRKMEEFISIEKYGKLYIDRILFESYIPIIFTCKNDNDEIFICVCCQNNEKGCKWLIGVTNGLSIVRMLKDEITIRELLLEFSSGQISVDYVNGIYEVAYHNSDWDKESIYLPKEDSYMFAEDGEFDEDIIYFSSIEHLQYGAEHYNNILNSLEMLSKDTDSIIEMANMFTSSIGNITITSEVINTLEVVGKVCNSLPMNTEKYIEEEKYKLTFNSESNTLASDLNTNFAYNDYNLAYAA